jgi:hypothetical protein
MRGTPAATPRTRTREAIGGMSKQIFGDRLYRSRSCRELRRKGEFSSHMDSHHGVRADVIQNDWTLIESLFVLNTSEA